MKLVRKIQLFILGGAVVVAGAAALQLSASNSAVAENDTTENTTETVKPSKRNRSGCEGRVIYQDDFTNAAEQTVNGVVSVKSYATPRQQQRGGYGGEEFFSDPLLEFFFGSPRRQQTPQQRQPQEEAQPRQIGLGSGVIISADGYIVTNNHVIEKAEKLEVTLNDNRNFPATVIGADPLTDLALIKIEAPDLHVIPMGNSEDLHVGEWVLAVGNPFGFTSTVTTGIVSAKARNISTTTQSPSRGNIESYIQTDAAVNSGNSGGALVNLDGELVGINAAIYSNTGTYAGCSFAIPTSIVQKVVADLKQFGTVQRAFLGITFMELSPEFVAEKDIKGVNAGIYVNEVTDRSAAKEAGLEPGDIITAINGLPTLSTAQMQEAITKFSPGDKVTITYFRDGKQNRCQATLRNNHGNTSVTRADTPSSLGAKLAAADNDTLRKLGLSSGVSVGTLGDGRFKDAGMKDNFIIVSINRTRVSSPDQVEAIYSAIRKSSDPEKAMFISGIYPDGQQAYYAVGLSD
ncbi:MAG: Do family serine endopeptidase [Muribaculaceae bacterium]|nr:Do family serine endopeptidase [Muribaculaceae bacterium]